MPDVRSLLPVADESFRLEDHLLDVVYGRLPEMVVGKSQQLLARCRKYAVGVIVPDLVLVVSKRALVRSVRPKKLSMIDCRILFAIHTFRGATVEEIAGKVYARESLIRRSVERLRKFGIIANREARLTVRKEVGQQTARVISVEAKLTRWRDAIEQAKTYLRFSNAAYIALPDAHVSRVKKIRLCCRAAGIGLIAVSPAACRIVVRAPISRAPSGEWFWVLNKTRGLGT